MIVHPLRGVCVKTEMMTRTFPTMVKVMMPLRRTTVARAAHSGIARSVPNSSEWYSPSGMRAAWSPGQLPFSAACRDASKTTLYHTTIDITHS